MYFQPLNAYATYHNCVGVVNDNKEYILYEECETKEKCYHSNSDGKATCIGVIVATECNTSTDNEELVGHTPKHNDREELYVQMCMH